MIGNASDPSSFDTSIVC